MQKRHKELPKFAKYGILAMLLADGAGIYIAHNKINQLPVGASTEMEDSFALVEPTRVYGEDRLSLPQPSAGTNVGAVPDVRPLQAYPSILDLKPIVPELASDLLEQPRDTAVAERAPIVPTVRIAALRPIKRQARIFSTAFARDILAPAMDPPAQSASLLPDISLAKLPVENDPVQPAGSTFDGDQIDAPQSPSSPVEVPVQAEATAPAGNAEAMSSDVNSQPALPASSGSGADELPSS